MLSPAGACNLTGQTMSLIMRDALIAKAHSSTMSPTGLIAETQ